jgi:chemotaxis protein MotB
MKKQTLFMILISALALNGCTFVFQGGRRSDLQKIENLSKQVDELSQVKDILDKRLAQEIKDKNVRLKMMEKGLVITFVADILFDSGKDKIRQEAMPILDKVARVLQENVPEFKVGIEGHSDNEPIKVSGWKSNWELSTARALSVLHYLIDQKNLIPERMSAIGYGEYYPVSAIDSKEGRRLNRRVEIVILPKATKVRETKDPAAPREPKEKIK